MNIANVEISVLKDFANGMEGIAEEFHVEVFKFGSSETKIEVDSIIHAVHTDGCSRMIMMIMIKVMINDDNDKGDDK